MTVAIRGETTADRAAALDVGRSAFGSDEEPAIVEAVHDQEGSFALLADDDGRIVGHVQRSRASIGAADVLALGPIGVLADRQGEGVAALEEARRRGEIAVMLLGSRLLPARRLPAELGARPPEPLHGVEESVFEIHAEDFMLVVLDGSTTLAGRCAGTRPSASPASERAG